MNSEISKISHKNADKKNKNASSETVLAQFVKYSHELSSTYLLTNIYLMGLKSVVKGHFSLEFYKNLNQT